MASWRRERSDRGVRRRRIRGFLCPVPSALWCRVLFSQSPVRYALCRVTGALCPCARSREAVVLSVDPDGIVSSRVIPNALALSRVQLLSLARRLGRGPSAFRDCVRKPGLHADVVGH